MVSVDTAIQVRREPKNALLVKEAITHVAMENGQQLVPTKSLPNARLAMAKTTTATAKSMMVHTAQKVQGATKGNVLVVLNPHQAPPHVGENANADSLAKEHASINSTETVPSGNTSAQPLNPPYNVDTSNLILPRTWFHV